MQPDAADRLILKLRAFVNGDLGDDERALFAALIAPGVAQAYDEDEVSGFAMTDWSSNRLPAALARLPLLATLATLTQILLHLTLELLRLALQHFLLPLLLGGLLTVTLLLRQILFALG